MSLIQGTPLRAFLTVQVAQCMSNNHKTVVILWEYNACTLANRGDSNEQYCWRHISCKLFITGLLTSCLFQISSPVVYYRFSHWLFSHQLFISGFSPDVYYRFPRRLFITGFLTGCFLTSCSFQVFHQMFISDFLAGCLLQIFSPVIRLLLTHQSSVDALACLFAIILLVQPLNWIPGVNILDDIICHLWDAQYIYWTAVCISREFIFRSAPILVHMSSVPLQAWIIFAMIWQSKSALFNPKLVYPTPHQKWLGTIEPL